MKILLNFIFAYWPLQVQCSQGPKLYFPSLKDNMLFISENENVNLTFWLDTSACKDPSGDYRMEVETRKHDGGREYDGKLARWNNTCIIISKRATRCTSDSGPAELFRKINRSHTEIVVRWIWEDDEFRDLVVNEATLELSVYYNAEDVDSFPTTVIALSATLILIIIILVVAIITKFLPYRKLTSEAELATKVKAYQICLLLPQMARNHIGKDISNCLLAKMEGDLLTQKTNEKESKLSDNQKKLNQERLLHILHPEFTLESEHHALILETMVTNDVHQDNDYCKVQCSDSVSRKTVWV